MPHSLQQPCTYLQDWQVGNTELANPRVLYGQLLRQAKTNGAGVKSCVRSLQKQECMQFAALAHLQGRQLGQLKTPSRVRNGEPKCLQVPQGLQAGL